MPVPARTTAPAAAALAALAVKGRAPKTGYSRDAVGPAWADVDSDGCRTRYQSAASFTGRNRALRARITASVIPVIVGSHRASVTRPLKSLTAPGDRPAAGRPPAQRLVVVSTVPDVGTACAPIPGPAPPGPGLVPSGG